MDINMENIMDINMENIMWNETEFKLKFVLDNPNFKLPQIVRIVQGHMVDEDDALASGQILTLHGKKKIEKIAGTDIHDKTVSIPVNCPYKVNILSIGEYRKVTCVNELCFCENSPNFIRTDEDIQTDDGCVYEAKSIFEIVEQVLSENGDIVGLMCKLENQSITLPVNLKANFTESIPRELMSQTFTIWEAVKQYGLPIQIQFLPVSDRNCGYGPQLGNIHLNKKVTTNAILATSVLEGIRHAVTFSAELPVTLQVSRGMLFEDTTSKEIVDLKKFDYFTSTDPYSSVAIQDEVYDDLRTPMLPRRKSYSNMDRYFDFRHMSAGFTEPINRADKPNSSPKQNKNIESGKDIKHLEKFVKGIKKSLAKITKNKRQKSKDSLEIEFDARSTRTTSEDGTFNTEVCSIDITTNGSDSTCNESYHRIAECMDALSIDNQSVTTPAIRRHSRKNSGDSGICLSGRKNRSRSRLTYETQSSHQSGSENVFENYSEWSLPTEVKRSSPPERKASSQIGLVNYLWSTNDNDRNNNESEEFNKKDEFKASQNFMAISYDAANEPQTDISSPLTAAHIASMENIRTLHEEGVGKILELLKLEGFQTIFQENQINGELLLDLEQADFVNDLNLSLFQAKKIMKYIKGWRPETESTQPSAMSRRNSLNSRDWSENDVLIHLNTINLLELGKFCHLNQVNGDLLLDILDKETMQSLKTDHNVKMSNLESKKLLNFVVKGWRPDSSPKKPAAL